MKISFLILLLATLLFAPALQANDNCIDEVDLCAERPPMVDLVASGIRITNVCSETANWCVTYTNVGDITSPATEMLVTFEYCPFEFITFCVMVPPVPVNSREVICGTVPNPCTFCLYGDAVLDPNNEIPEISESNNTTEGDACC